MVNDTWGKLDIKNSDELDQYYWEQGYFHLNPNNKTKYIRDFSEIRLRDISLFTLGQIEGKEILDIGCGTGLYSLTFLKLGAKTVCGQDLSQSYIKNISEKAKSLGYSNFVGKVGDCANLQFDDNKFDLIFSGDVFEHITDELKEKFLHEAYRVLKPGGLFTIKTPNKSYLKFTNWLHRIQVITKFKNPFNVHIAHTKNNPDNEHHGLVTHKEFINIIDKTMFHSPKVTKTDLYKRGVPKFISKILGKYNTFNQHIIITIQKPIFYGIYK